MVIRKKKKAPNNQRFSHMHSHAFKNQIIGFDM